MITICTNLLKLCFQKHDFNECAGLYALMTIYITRFNNFYNIFILAFHEVRYIFIIISFYYNSTFCQNVLKLCYHLEEPNESTQQHRQH